MDEQHSSKPPDDAQKSFEDYSCGLYKDRLLIPGRLYIAKSHVTFQPQFGQVPVNINISDITGLHKKNTAYVFPNAIEIATKPQKYFFGSFYFRDQAFATLQSLLPSQFKTEGEHEHTEMENEEPGVNSLSLPNLLDQAKIYLNPSPSNPSNPSSTHPSHPSHPSHPLPNPSSHPTHNAHNTSATSEAREREVDTPAKKVHFNDSLNSDESSQRRTRAYSANSDDEELKPFAAELQPFAAKGLAVFKRMTKSASERSVFDRSNTPPPPATSFSPPPPSSHSLSANNSPAVSPIPSHRPHEQLELDHNDDSQQQQIQQDNVHNSSSLSADNFSEHAGDVGTADGSEIHSSEISPAISPLHSPHIGVDSIEGDNNSGNTQGQDEHDHEQGGDSQSENNNNNNNNNSSLTGSPTLPSSSSFTSTSAPPSPSPVKVKQPEPEKLKLPPIVENCEHMTYTSDAFLLYIDENFPCPIQDFYRIIISSNFWSEVNDSLGYTEATLTPWLTKTTATGTPCCLIRQLNFKMELNGKIGPKSTRVQQAQRCRLKNSKELVVETTSISLDVPYSDNFTTDNLLIIKSIGDGSSCNLRIACRVNFLKTTWGLGGIIEKNANQGSKDFFAQWLILVRPKIEKEYTKQRVLASPPPRAPANHQKQPAHRNHPSSISPSPLSQSTNSQQQQQQQPLASNTTNSTTTTSTSITSSSSSIQPPSSPQPGPSQPPAADKQHQISQLPMPVVALSFVVLLIITIGLPYVFYLHSRVAYAESQIVEFNHAAERVDNKIAFMQLYINYLKEHPNSPPPPTPSTPRDELKAEIAGLAHLLDLANSLEVRMGAWKLRLDSAETSLRGSQDIVGELRNEIGMVLNHADETMKMGGLTDGGGAGGWVYFLVAVIGSLAVVGGSVYYFRQSLPFKLKIN